MDLRSPTSESSLQLTLENKELETLKQKYLDKMNPLLRGKTDVIGFVYVINGELNTAEVYNNKNLFRALWPKLLDAAITEAITEHLASAHFPPMSAAEVKAFFETALSGAVTERRPWKTTHVKTYSTPTTVLFETRDVEADDVWLHKSFVYRGKDSVVVPLDQESRLQERLGIQRPLVR